MRLFIALPLPEQIQEALSKIIRDLRQASAAVRWVDPHNIHLTLRFLGDTDPSLLPELKQLIDRVAQQQASLTLGLNRLGAFPNLSKPRVYWISTADQAIIENLRNLAQRIELDICKLGFQAEGRPFKPHLTLGRLKQPHNVDRMAQAIKTYPIPTLRVQLSRIVLFQSTLTPKGAIYQSLHESPLGDER